MEPFFLKAGTGEIFLELTISQSLVTSTFLNTAVLAGLTVPHLLLLIESILLETELSLILNYQFKPLLIVKLVVLAMVVNPFLFTHLHIRRVFLKNLAKTMLLRILKSSLVLIFKDVWIAPSLLLLILQLTLVDVGLLITTKTGRLVNMAQFLELIR